MIVIDREFQCYLDQFNEITILLPKTYNGGKSSKFTLEEEEGSSQQLTIKEQLELDHSIKYICSCEKEPEIGRQYWIVDEHNRRTDLQIGAVIRTREFDERFFYKGELGVQYSKNVTTVKIWAPTATNVRLKLATPDEVEEEPIDMKREQLGIWTFSINRDLECYRYSFLVCVNLEWREAVDPYAVAVNENGKLGVIVDLSKTRLEDIRPSRHLEHPVDCIIYETHIRDFTIHKNSGVSRKGTYLGACELYTRGKKGTATGLSYIKELGVTHIEFLPFNDFEGVDESSRKQEYNWGYNPLHFNVPEGSYSTNPADPYSRIKELKQMIQTIHQEDLRIIMDVVYNHVYIREESAFEKIVPGYYFRHDENGMPSNGTGVGNDIASERLMVRKFIVDSVTFWKREYHIDGFRFDLMGILDVDTMREVRSALDQIDKKTMIIGEGWDLNTPLPAEKKANIRNQRELPRIGQFNDWFRDSIKGSTFNLYDKGYALANEHYYDSGKKVIAGSIGLSKKEKGLFLEPNQCVNYVESHDNHTFWDKLNVCEADDPMEFRKKRQKLANALVLLSQGIPFLHSGQEFFRTKNGEGNSYRSPDEVNQLDWDLKEKNMEYVQYVMGLIKLRKSHGAFRLPNSDLIRKHMKFLSLPKPLIGYSLNDVALFGRWGTIITIFNPKMEEFSVDLPDKGWNLLVNESVAGLEPITHIRDKKVTIMPCSCFVLAK